ncbi:hypothetical protein K431DRAFT_257149 [Polychaeton citri CBS 116435]|uniref:N-acetyltransferase ECO1 n=1 Tax=Polychaeton citri CBS 116435 TaxID=1314669 RepID=A0A9P4PZC7_9PEZI|nr:hypothetical protein K431DRAFT_257149 [Polychaeton citri CBS 116435]
MTQTQLSLGQPVQKSCQACGMEFVLSSEEDRVLHQQHHTNVTQGYHIGKTFRWKDWVCFKSERPGDMILAIDRSRPMPQRRRAMEVLKVVERELGAVEIGGDELWGTIPDKSDLKGRFTNYVYVREGRCIAYLLMERITKAHPVIAPKSRSKEGSAFTSSQPIQLSNKHIPAVIGVSRVWTLPTYRSHDIATSLLDTATAHLLGRDGSCDEPGRGCISCIAPNRAEYRVLTADEKIKRVAFSQPTQAGARLARRWFGKLYGWMVYAN